MGVSEIRGARITIRRRLTWADTDAAGHNHFSVAVRWLEEAEQELRRSIGLSTGITPHIPRVHLQLDYRERLWFDQEVDVTVGVVSVGASSCTFLLEVRTMAGVVAIDGRYVMVHSPDVNGGTEPWPAHIRAALTGVL